MCTTFMKSRPCRRTNERFGKPSQSPVEFPTIMDSISNYDFPTINEVLTRYKSFEMESECKRNRVGNAKLQIIRLHVDVLNK